MSYGYDPQEREIILAVLMYAQMRGNNQGVVKLVNPGIPRHARQGRLQVARHGLVCATVDGQLNHAMVAVSRGAEEVISLARKGGAGVVAVKNIATSSGAIGYYSRKITDSGFVGIVMAGATPVVAPEGSYQAVFGTNPLSIAVPGDESPVVLDMATAAMAFFGVIEAKTAGQILPEGVAFSRSGEGTRDPDEALTGALRTFDSSRKGSGMSFMIQALTGPLIGAAYLGLGNSPDNWAGHLLLAIDPEMFAGLSELRSGVATIADSVRAATPLPDVARVYAPGERGDQTAAQVQEQGWLDLEQNLWEGLIAVASRAPGSS